MKYPFKIHLMFWSEWLTSNARPWPVRAPCRAIRYIVNTFRGARPVKLATGEYGTEGYWARVHAIDGSDYIEFGGACPIQGYGEVDGRNAYYRSRGTGWSLEIAPLGKLVDDDCIEWQYWSGRVYHFPDGGWVHPAVTRANLDRAAAQYYEEKASKP